MADEKALHFLPWLRSGLGAISITGNGRRKATLALQVVDSVGNPMLDDSAALAKKSHEVTLKGPGDVIGFDASLVARVEPKPGANDFEPNYFPFIEFIDPDFPWRYSPSDDANGKLLPWIVLLVLTSDEYQIVQSGSGQGVKIRINSKGGAYPLPDLENAQAWAHVQIAGPLQNDSNALAGYLADNPGLHCSRLMCPRKLEPLTRYSAFVVPVYDDGVRAGLGLPLDGGISYAWSAGAQDPPVLPVYFQWDFQTSEKGDFEELIKRIKFIRGVPEGVGIRSIDGSNPGFLKDGTGGSGGAGQASQAEPAKDVFQLEGALVPPGFMNGESGDLKRELLTNSGFTSSVLPVLNASLSSTQALDLEAPDPLVTVPVYGYHFQRTTQIVPPDSPGHWNVQNSWVNELNLDRRYRVPASFITSVVQQNQEEYMEECWEQVGDIREANQALRLAGTSKLLNDSVRQRHINPLDDARFTLISRPYHHYYIHNDGQSERSFKYRFEQSGLPPAITSTAFRGIASKTIGLQKENLFGPWDVARQNDNFWRKALRFILFIFMLLIRWLSALVKLADKYEPLLPSLKAIAQGSSGGQTQPSNIIARLAASIAIVLIQFGLWIRGLIPFLERLEYHLKVPAVNELPRTSRLDTNLQRELESQLGVSLPSQSVAPLKSEIIEVKPIDIAGAFRTQFDIHSDLMDRLNSIISLGAVCPSLSSYDPIMVAPHIDLPVYKYLSERSVDLMVPGLKELDNNSVVLMEENRKFIQSVMVGNNHEMGREMVWREYPTDQRGTIFRYFWDIRTADNPPPDIADINTWSKELGNNTPAVTQATDDRLVLAIKADLVRRYPDFIVFAICTKGTMNRSEWEGVFGVIDGTSPNSPHVDFTVYKPVLSANVSVDILFVGFEFSLDDLRAGRAIGQEYYFVFMQQPSLPRFGLDDGTDSPTIYSWNDMSWGHVTTDSNSGWILQLANPDAVPDKTLWMKNSAAMGMITFQRPVRIVRPSTDFTEERA